MTIQGGGGGGPKIPPKNPPPVSTTTGQPKTEKTEKAPSSPPAPSASPPPAKDGFEKAAHTDPRMQQAAFTAGEGVSTSAIESMVRLLEDTRTQILDEHKALREKSIALVKQLAAAGFEKSVVEQKRAELTELRERLNQLRKRLQHIQRRLKSALGKPQKHDLDVSKQLAAHLEKMQKLEPGLQKALLALLALEQACGGVADGGLLKLIGDATAEERGAALARVSPGSIVARAVGAVLGGKEEQKALPASPAPSLSPSPPDGLDGLRGLAETLLSSL